MTLFFFKPKPVELIAFTDNPLLAQDFPIANSSAKLPSYYKNTPSKRQIDSPHPVENSLNYFSTIRRCFGINQFNLTGLTLPLWSDYSMLINEGQLFAKGAACTPSNSTFSVQAENLYEGVLENTHCIKLLSPWLLDCKEDVKFLSTQNYYEVNSPLWTMPSGIVDYRHQNSTNIFLLIKKDLPNQEIFLRAGTPLLKIIPLTERPVKLRVELIDDIRKKVKVPRDIFFSNSFSKLIKHAKNNGCPFNK